MGLRAATSRIYRARSAPTSSAVRRSGTRSPGCCWRCRSLLPARPGLNFGVEFKGGSVFTFKAPSASIEQVRTAVTDGGAHQAIVQKA